MTQKNFRLFLILTFCGIAAVGAILLPGNRNVTPVQAADELQSNLEPLTIGTVAPAIDIESWVQDGKGFFKPVTQFEADKVYVVEFWATWCRPCVASMPHLASLQNKYRGNNVQVVSISDEPLETVNEFLTREAEVAEGEKKTFADITSAYCLTTDPDRSVYEAYMTASKQQGIPTAFIVGKSGLVEWIGHPMNMDEPLEKVVGDAWDRDAFAKELEAEAKFNEVLEEISTLAGAGKFDEAIRLINDQIKGDVPAEIRDRWITILPRFKVTAGMVDEDVANYFTQDLANNKGNAVGVAKVGWFLYQASREQNGLEGLLTASATALNAEIEGTDEKTKPVVLDTLSHLYDAAGDIDAAIEAQQKAVDLSEGRTAQRLARYLKELQDKKANADKPAE